MRTLARYIGGGDAFATQARNEGTLRNLADRLYLDHAATTPVSAAAREAVAQGIAIWANPSSPHAPGRAARAALENARARIKATLGWAGEVIFTSGASDAIAMALTRTKADAMLISQIEHEAVLRAAAPAVVLPVNADGLVEPHGLAGRLGASVATVPLVAVQSANNETGVLQPLADLAPLVHKAGGILFVDASQTAGKLPLPDADLIAVSAHKFGGPPGVGALLVGDLGLLNPTGGQEGGYRPGTENLPGILGMAAALDAPRGWLDRAADLRAHLDGAIEGAGGQVVAKGSPRIPTIASYRMHGVTSAAQLIQFDLAGIAVSAGSACSSGSVRSSHVLIAMGWSEADASQVIRVSFGPDTTRADVYRFVEVWRRISGTARARAA